MTNRGFGLNRRPMLLVVILALGVALLVACGGGGDDDDDGGTPTDVATTTTAGGTPASGGDGEFEDQEFSVGQEFWHSGFHVTVGDGTLSAVEEGIFGNEVAYVLSIGATFENLGEDQTFFDGDIALVGGGTSYTLRGSTDIPGVPSGLSSNGTLDFEVDEGFDPESAYLVVGGAGENKAQVPLGPGGGELVDLAPSEPAVSGSISLQLIDLNVTSAELRADNPITYRELDEGKLALTLEFDVTSRKSGNWSIFANEFALILPGGSAAAVDGSDLSSLPGSDTGVDTTGLYVRFLVDDPPAGEYTLRFTPSDRWLSEGDPAEGTFTFDLT